MSRHYFNNLDLLQDYPEDQSYLDSRAGFGATQEEDLYKSSFPQEPYEPKDMGVEVFETMKVEDYEKKIYIIQQKEHQIQRQSYTYDAKVLFDFWKAISKARKKLPPRPPSSKPSADKKMAKHIEEKFKHQENLTFFLGLDPRDVKFSLDKYAKEEAQDQNISKFYEKQEMESSMRESRKKSVKPAERKKRIENSLQRLHPNQSAVVPETEEEKAIKQRNLFMKRLTQVFISEKMSYQNYCRPDVLYPYWQSLETKREDNLEGDPAKTKSDMEQYFQERVEILIDLFYKRNGYRSDEPKVLMKFWMKTISVLLIHFNSIKKDDKERLLLDFEYPDDIYSILTNYLQQKKDSEDISRFVDIKAQNEKRKEDHEQSVKILQSKQKDRMEEMSKPKDRMKVGKAILELLKMHPEDKVLRKMLLMEFQDTRIAKHPLEYDVVDSDEENKLKIRHPTQKGGVIMNIEDLEIPDKLKAEEISQLFDAHLRSFYSTKNFELKTIEKERLQQVKDDRLLRSLIEKSAEKYLDIRKRRYEEKIPTMNDYLSVLYKDCFRRYKEASKRHFPHITYGQGKRLKKRSFPLTLKRYFFSSMKAFVRKKYALVKDKENRLAFWAPGCSSGNQPTLNKRVMEQQRTTKDEKRLSDRPQTSAWDKNGYLPERLKVMMTFSDAVECTFQPRVCSRMPNVLKREMKRIHNWAAANVDRRGTFENFLAKFGDNFVRMPKVFKYGIFRRAQLTAKRGELLSSYKLIAENFDLFAMKVEFQDPDRNKDHPVFNYQKMGCDEKVIKNLPMEDFGDQSNRNFLLEVYGFIKNLEKYEHGLSQTQKNIQKLMSKSDGFKRSVNIPPMQASTYAARRNIIKDQMCPLGQECPSIKPRWPVSDVSGVVPLGADCLFAHHLYELKFSRELRERRRMLQDSLACVNKKLQGEVKAKPWNPGGANFSDCIGCGESLGGKGNKGICLFCQMRKTNLKRLDQYREKASLMKSMIVERKGFKEKDAERTKKYESLNKKMGCLAKANALCAKERYTEAFKVLIQAVELVKNEIEHNEELQKTKSMVIKGRLGLQRDMDITTEQVFLSTLPQNLNPDDPNEPHRLRMYAQMTGMVDGPQADANEFLNLQIEQMYLKIERALGENVRDIEKMQIKIERLEDEDDMVAKGKPSKKKTKMCPQWLEDGRCEKEQGLCPYAHSNIQLDLVPNEKKINHLNTTIKQRMTDLRDSKAKTSWVKCAVRGSDKYQDTQTMDRQADIKKLRQTPAKGLSKARSFKDHTIKTIYDKDIDDLKTEVADRRKKY